MNNARSLVIRSHRRKEEHFLKIKDYEIAYIIYLDIVTIRKQHRQSIQSHSPSRSWRQSIFEGGTEILVDWLRFVVPRRFVLFIYYIDIYII
jgi:hypothetical protein